MFDCFIVTRKIKATERNMAGASGYPFRAVVDYRDYTYTWCKVEQMPGEMLVLAPDEVVRCWTRPSARGPRRH